MWLREVIWTATFNCCYEGNAQLGKPAVYESEQIIEGFNTRPTESLGDWARRVAEEKASLMGQESCSELSNIFSVCLMEVTVISTDELETLPPKCTEFAIGTIRSMIRRYEETDDKDRKLKLGNTIVKAIKEYGCDKIFEEFLRR